MGSVRALAVLGRWLGPWADATRSPAVATREDVVDGIRVRLYSDSSTLRPYLIAPGLHYAGPDDPRMDRFCRVLAAAGHMVIAPFIPDYLALTPTSAAIRDFERLFAARERWTTEKPVVFSISFGSLLAFALAAKHGDDIAGTVIFGGYADFQSTLEFSLTGAVASGRAIQRDPLNQPVVLMNLLAHLDPPCVGTDAVAVRTAWRAYIERTWGRAEMKVPARFAALADELAPSVPETVRELFHIGIGTRPGAASMAFAALARFDARDLDPTPYLAHVRGHVDLVHGADDDVIPFEHSHALAAKLTGADVRVHVTGMYGHTGANRPKLADATRELVTLLRVLRLLAA